MLVYDLSNMATSMTTETYDWRKFKEFITYHIGQVKIAS